MRRLITTMMALLMALSFSTVGFAVEQKTAGTHEMMTSGENAEHARLLTATGKVTSVEPQAITISEKIGGKEEMDVGTIVDKDTIVKVKGKVATLSDIKVGDTVTIRYLKSDDLYAKEIDKA